MNNDPNTPLPGESGEDFAKRKRIVAAALKSFKQDNAVSEHDRIMNLAAEATLRARDALGGQSPLFMDPRTMYQLAAMSYLESFHSWSKDDLVYLISILHADIFLENHR
jgi:hypothetical protein